MTALRIAVTGAAGAGTSALATALAERLDLPVVSDELRAGREAGDSPASSLAPEEARRFLREEWRRRVAAERARPAGFVADGCCLDDVALAVHHGCAAAGDPAWEALLVAAAAHAGGYDAILVLPPQVSVRRGEAPSAAAALELRYQLVLEAVLARHAAAPRVHACPADVDPSARVAWALGVARTSGGRAGKVSLVGAGPGDPALLTVRARELLAGCDVVAYDELVPPALLAVAAAGAERLAVGRRCRGKREPVRLHPDVLARARAGLRVVRLKAGDPFVFGRGGEEAEELAAAGVAFEVVPGVSAALGAAAAAWIPLTHRDISSDVTFATGHDLTHATAPGRSDWAGLARGGTLVLYMASRSLGENLARLAAQGRPPATPAAWIAAATHPAQEIVVGTLADLAGRVQERSGARAGDAPALVIVGEVVAMRERLLALVAAGRAA